MPCEFAFNLYFWSNYHNVCLFHSLQFRVPECCLHRDADGPLCSAEGGVLHISEGPGFLYTNHSQPEGVFEGCYTDRYKQEVRKDTSCQPAAEILLTVHNKFMVVCVFVCNILLLFLTVLIISSQALLQAPLPRSSAELQWWRSR